MLSNLTLKQRTLFQLGFNVLLQVFIIWGTLSSMSATAIISGSLLIAFLQTSLYLNSIMGSKHFLESLISSAQQMAKGNLADRVPEGKFQTAREGLGTMQVLQDSLRDVIGNLNEGAHHVSLASAEIASGNMDLSHRTEQGSADLQSAAGALRNMTDTARKNLDAVQEASTLSQNASQLVRQSGEVVAEAVKAMNGVSDSSRKISDIISVIDGIAFQTNILALNAAVEAARAGEQGRGFAVVASEVRLLAGRSAEAAKEIKGLISRSVEQVESGSGLVNAAGERMQEVVQSVERVTLLIGEATQMAQAQSNGIHDVSDSVDRLDQSMQQNAALVEEGAAAAGTLREQAQRLTDLVQRFRLA